MKILYIAPSYKPAYVYGGTTVVLAQLAEKMVHCGHSVTVYTTTANGDTELAVSPNVPTEVDNIIVHYFTRVTKDHTQASPALWRFLDKTIDQFDVIHIHSWWNFLVVGAVWICHKHRVKPILSPHGMFSDYIVNTNNAYWKQILHKLIGKRLLKNTYLHVSTDMEWKESQRIVPGWSGEVIPNLVTLPEYLPAFVKNDIFTIGFLSRIDPKKGVDLLITALGKVQFPYQLLIAGSGDDTYVQSLKELARRCGNDRYIKWVGWKDAETKFSYLSSLDLFALISHSENFAVVVIESLSVGTPVLVSDQVGLSAYVAKNKYGWITTSDAEAIAAQLTRSREELTRRKNIREIAPARIRQEYEGESIINKYTQFYTLVNAYNKDNKREKDLHFIAGIVY